jgi:hypothetical protein
MDEIDGHVDKYKIHNTVLRKREIPREEESVIIRDILNEQGVSVWTGLTWLDIELSERQEMS